MNNYNERYTKVTEETEQEYKYRLCEARAEEKLTWNDVAAIYNLNTGKSVTGDALRKWFSTHERNNLVSMDEEDPVDILKQIRIEKYKLSDERVQNNAILRRISREESLKEIAHDAVQQISEKIKLDPIYSTGIDNHGDNQAILQLSDFHYGVDITNPWNTYNPEIARKRIQILRDKVITRLTENKVKVLHVANLGDMICGRIHLQLRINSRVDVITQVIEISELIAELLTDLSTFVKVEYYDTLDNHSRLEPSLKEHIDLESLARITTWYLDERLKGNKNIVIHKEHEYGDDIIRFNVFDHKVIGVHGHKDSPSKIVSNLTLLTKEHYDIILSAHLHHPFVEEQNDAILIQNGSGMGVDDYAEKLRLTSKPSQNLIIVSKDNIMDAFYRIVLD